MIAQDNTSNPLIRALDYLADLWRARHRRYRPEQHYLRGKPSGLARPRHPHA